MNRNAILQQYALARASGYALGSFSPRNTPLVPYVLEAAQAVSSPVIVQISSNELRWFDMPAREFADAFYDAAARAGVPAFLHLDHTYDLETIVTAMDAGFTSVMIDGSRLPFEENIALTRRVADAAHARGVAVEAELGSIGGADKLETGHDERLFTDPEQAAEFVLRTGCDSLAVSVGTAHGVYPVANPALDFARLDRITERTDAPLVLHGGSGLPAESVRRAIAAGKRGGIVKLNIATDLELIFQRVMGVTRMPNRETELLPAEKLREAGLAVRAFCEDRMRAFLGSAGRAGAEGGHGKA